jgi:hypothetical protein
MESDVPHKAKGTYVDISRGILKRVRRIDLTHPDWLQIDISSGNL